MPHFTLTNTGTGKTLTCTEVCMKTGLKHVDIGTLAKENDLYDGWDKQYQCPILEEDKVTARESFVDRC